MFKVNAEEKLAQFDALPEAAQLELWNGYLDLMQDDQEHTHEYHEAFQLLRDQEVLEGSYTPAEDLADIAGDCTHPGFWEMADQEAWEIAQIAAYERDAIA